MTYPIVHSGNRSEVLRINERVLFRIGDLPVRDQCNTGIIRTDKGVVLIDYPEQQPNEEIIGEAEELLGLPVTHIFLTHAHGDHRNGLAALHRRGIELLAREPTLREIEACYPSLPNPKRAVQPGQMVELGGVRFGFWLPQRLPSHSPWDMAVILPDDGVIFTGDFLVPPYYTYLFACSGENWLAELENFDRTMGDIFGAACGDTLLLMGHGLPQLGSEACCTERTYLGKLIALRRKLAELGVTDFTEESGIPERSMESFVELCGITSEPTVRRQLRELASSPAEYLKRSPQSSDQIGCLHRLSTP